MLRISRESISYLATAEGVLNLAGVLLFAEQPEWIKPQFVVKAICYPGTQIHVSDYTDTEDFAGPLRKVFDDALAFIMRNLHKVQAGRGVNAPGVPEISESVFEDYWSMPWCTEIISSMRRSVSSFLMTASRSSVPVTCRTI